MMATRAPLLMWKRGCAVAAIALILGALCVGGAQTAAGAALLAALLSATLAAACFSVTPDALRDAVRRNWLPALAALTFVSGALVTAWIAPENAVPPLIRAAWHPLWAELTPGFGAISLTPYRTIEGLIAFFAPLAAFGVGVLTIQDREDRRAASLLLLAAAGVFAVSSLFWLWSGRDGQTRLEALFGSANSAATTFGVLALMLSARLLRISQRPNPRVMAQVPPRLRAAWIVFVAPATLSVLALTLTCLMLTGSRAGIAATFGGFALFGLLVWAPRRRQPHRPSDARASVLIAVALLGIVLFAFGGQFVLARLLHVSEDASVRQTLIDMHWRIFLERPLLGHGLHTFHELNAHYMTPETWRDASYVGAVHNIYVQALEEVGVIGFALLALMLVPPLARAAWAAWVNRSGAEWAAAAFAATMLALAHGMVDFGLQTPAIAALVMFCLGAFTNGEMRAARTAPTPARKS